MTVEPEDPPFHFEIWQGPGRSFGDEPKAIYYVENHNGQCSYGELALDFQIAATALLETYRSEQLGNWMAPVAHMIRQTLELRMKALLSSILARDPAVDKKPLGQHDLLRLWGVAYTWLQANGFPIDRDARLSPTLHLISAYDAIDPSGDLFRFGMSRKTAFKKQKSYDRVGINYKVMAQEFADADGLFCHWDAAVFRLTMAEEHGWTMDPYFEVDDFPKVEHPPASDLCGVTTAGTRSEECGSH
ncbi:hypothetical protein [Sphingobium sp. Sx8-8]|uniref:hypothetical protein n=1 Tax=Sphingobium sp. Sx8-8 TaxID=2933617 RepID=UPI001F5AAF8E|nr:hypothetical protein [Sphingobium sp. Sx8-8]